ncbi:glycosyltransferase family 2 protein [Candidatus Cloacimonadota bacterium]
MRISLIIPVFNRLHLLEKCLLSVYKQVLPPTEIILSDDGSTEDIVGFHKAQKQLSPYPIKLVRQQHEGFRLARIRNNAVSAARGDLLVFLDQDIIIPPLYLDDIATQMKPGIFISSFPVRLSEAQSEALDRRAIESYNFKQVLLPRQVKKIHRQYREDYLSYLLCKYLGVGNHGAKLRGGVATISREDYVKVNGYDENFQWWGGEDDDMGRRLLAIGTVGKNISYHHFTLHLYHEPFHQNNRKHNSGYISKRKKEIDRLNYRCAAGLDSERADIEVFD